MFCQNTCKPLTCLDELLNWSKENCNQKYSIEHLKKSSLERQNDNKAKILLCHDMKNNYLEDKFMQGHSNRHAYRFHEWDLIDTFVYFSHYFVTIPTESWINASHKNGVKILGTFITEFDQGYKICKEFVSDRDKIHTIVEKLVSLIEYFGFDGWLINIENRIDEQDVSNLVYFVQILTKTLKTKNNAYTVIWYDSVISSGELKWQNELNHLNKQFFDMCDGFFVNYTWQQNNLENIVKNSDDRLDDVYVGIDVFGRGCLGGGGYECHLAIDEIQKYGLNVALFAPGWIHEANDEQEFNENSQKFWSLIEKYVVKRKLIELPLISNFCQGCGNSFYIDGILISKNEWYNLNLQSTLSSFAHNPSIKWCFDDAFYGGNCIQLAKYSSNILFECDAEVKNDCLKLAYVYKLSNDCAKTTNEDNGGHFSIEIKYSLNGASKSFILKQDLIIADEFELINSGIKQVENTNWIQESFALRVKCSFLLNKIVIHNQLDTSIYLGYFKLSTNEETEQDSSQISLDISIGRTCLMHLSSEYYYLIELKWNEIEAIDHVDIFLNNHTLLDQLAWYAGSTKSNKFNLCFKLTQFDYAYSNEKQIGNDHKDNCVQINAKAVYKYLQINSNQNLINVWIPGRAKISKLIYDFEFF